MVAFSNGLIWNEKKSRWEDEEGNYGSLHKRVCPKCDKPRLDLNGVEDCDFCLQGLTVCDFIEFACCGHGNDDRAYIALKDGRVFYRERRVGKPREQGVGEMSGGLKND